MTSKQVLQLFQQTNALLSGHFKLSSGLHSGAYFQSARALEDPKVAAQFGKALSKKISAGIDTVVSPALGGLIIGYETARCYGARFIFCERGQAGAMELRRGFTLRRGEKVALIEDVITTGGSSQEVIDVVESAGGKVVELLSLVESATPHLILQRQ